MKPDTEIMPDRGESITMMEPLIISASSKHREELSDLALELTALTSGFRRSLPEGILVALADLVRSMNCYYSNLIEGHDTHPIDIERALKEDLSTNTDKRNLQLEAKAHIAVQKWIDDGGLKEKASCKNSILEIHRRFCALLPKELLWVENPETKEKINVTPGELRPSDVKVGQHIPPSPGALERFLDRYEKVYSNLGTAETIIATATAHHRLVWIHPFLDGNGRVARLVSYAMFLDTLNTGGIWSIARGLAKNVDIYKQHLAQCDLKRRNNFDGRGNLSEEKLAAFTKFFLKTCIDQVKFMEKLLQPDKLRTRIVMWAEEEIRLKGLPPKTEKILEAMLYRGELPRGEIPAIVNAGERHARRIVSALTERGVLVSESTRAPLRLVFPAKLASRWMPGLFPDR